MANFVKLTRAGEAQSPVWVNLDAVRTMFRLVVAGNPPLTMLTYPDTLPVQVVETPETIVLMATGAPRRVVDVALGAAS